jgi:hypothetical protein
VLKRINSSSEQVFINCGVFGQMFGGDNAVIDDVDLGVQPAAETAPVIQPAK